MGKPQGSNFKEVKFSAWTKRENKRRNDIIKREVITAIETILHHYHGHVTSSIRSQTWLLLKQLVISMFPGDKDLKNLGNAARADYSSMGNAPPPLLEIPYDFISHSNTFRDCYSRLPSNSIFSHDSPRNWDYNVFTNTNAQGLPNESSHMMPYPPLQTFDTRNPSFFGESDYVQHRIDVSEIDRVSGLNSSRGSNKNMSIAKSVNSDANNIIRQPNKKNTVDTHLSKNINSTKNIQTTEANGTAVVKKSSKVPIKTIRKVSSSKTLSSEIIEIFSSDEETENITEAGGKVTQNHDGQQIHMKEEMIDHVSRTRKITAQERLTQTTKVQPRNNEEQQPKNIEVQPKNNGEEQPKNDKEAQYKNYEIQPKNNEEVQTKNHGEEPNNNNEEQQTKCNEEVQDENNGVQPKNDEGVQPKNYEEKRNKNINEQRPNSNDDVQDKNNEAQLKNNKEQPKNDEELQYQNNEGQPKTNEEQPEDNERQQPKKNEQVQNENTGAQPEDNERQQPKKNEQVQNENTEAQPENNEVQPKKNEKEKPKNDKEVQHENNEVQVNNNEEQPENNEEKHPKNNEDVQPKNNEEEKLKNKGEVKHKNNEMQLKNDSVQTENNKQVQPKNNGEVQTKNYEEQPKNKEEVESKNNGEEQPKNNEKEQHKSNREEQPKNNEEEQPKNNKEEQCKNNEKAQPENYLEVGEKHKNNEVQLKTNLNKSSCIFKGILKIKSVAELNSGKGFDEDLSVPNTAILKKLNNVPTKTIRKVRSSKTQISEVIEILSSDDETENITKARGKRTDNHGNKRINIKEEVMSHASQAQKNTPGEQPTQPTKEQPNNNEEKPEDKREVQPKNNKEEHTTTSKTMTEEETENNPQEIPRKRPFSDLQIACFPQNTLANPAKKIILDSPPDLNSNPNHGNMTMMPRNISIGPLSGNESQYIKDCHELKKDILERRNVNANPGQMPISEGHISNADCENTYMENPPKRFIYDSKLANPPKIVESNVPKASIGTKEIVVAKPPMIVQKDNAMFSAKSGEKTLGNPLRIAATNTTKASMSKQIKVTNPAKIVHVNKQTVNSEFILFDPPMILQMYSSMSNGNRKHTTLDNLLKMNTKKASVKIEPKNVIPDKPNLIANRGQTHTENPPKKIKLEAQTACRNSATISSSHRVTNVFDTSKNVPIHTPNVNVPGRKLNTPNHGSVAHVICKKEVDETFCQAYPNMDKIKCERNSDTSGFCTKVILNTAMLGGIRSDKFEHQPNASNSHILHLKEKMLVATAVTRIAGSPVYSTFTDDEKFGFIDCIISCLANLNNKHTKHALPKQFTKFDGEIKRKIHSMSSRIEIYAKSVGILDFCTAFNFKSHQVVQTIFEGANRELARLSEKRERKKFLRDLQHKYKH